MDFVDIMNELGENKVALRYGAMLPVEILDGYADDYTKEIVVFFKVREKGHPPKSPFPSNSTYIKIKGNVLMGWLELLYVVYACVAVKFLLEYAGKGRCRRAGHRR